MNLFNKENDFKFVVRKWNTDNDQSNANYDVENEIIYNTEVLKYNLCNCSDVLLLERGGITVIAVDETQVIIKNCAPLTNCVTKTNGRTTVNANSDNNIVNTNGFEFFQYEAKFVRETTRSKSS